MTQEKILEYNKRCAEFLGYKYYPHNYEGKFPSGKPGWQKEKAHLKVGGYLCRSHNQLRFHSDWNWIMEVVEAIEKLDFGIKQCRKVVEIYQDSTKENIFYIKKTSRKESIVQAINQFLIWYNEQSS